MNSVVVESRMKLLVILSFFTYIIAQERRVPIVVNTWPFKSANIKAWNALNDGLSAIDAVVQGCTVCEEEQCDGSVGFGGSPNENAETTLDAMVMDGSSMRVGAVGNLRFIKEAVAVARHVLDYTKHTLLVGDQATEFAILMGFENQTLSTSQTDKMINEWRNKNCQPNYWKNVLPSSENSCGPYEKIFPLAIEKYEVVTSRVGKHNHDTIGMIAIDKENNIAVGTSTNGLTYKLPGRVGDSPIPGAGGYAENDVGGAAATGDGDVMMRFSPSFLAVEFLRNGFTPQETAEKVIDRIQRYYANHAAAIVVVDKNGNYGAACQIFNSFPISIYYPGLNETKIETAECRKFNEQSTTENSSTTEKKSNGGENLKSFLNFVIFVSLANFLNKI